MTTYDTCVIGASPIMIMEALARSRAGERVVLLDEKPALGGAWMPATVFGMEMDSGAHLLYMQDHDVNAQVQCIEEACGIRFELLSPQPRGEKRVGLYQSVHLSLVWPEASNGWAAGISAVVTVARQNIRAIRGHSAQHRYPAGGSAAWMNAAGVTLRRQGVDVQPSARVTAIRDGSVTYEQGGERCVTSKRVIATSRIHDAKGVDLPAQQVSLGHLFLLVRDAGPARFSFFKYCDHPAFFAAADITTTGRCPKADTRVIAMALAKGIADRAGLSLEAERDLRERCLIGADAVVVATQYRSYESLQRSRGDVDAFNEAHPGIELVFCNNLSQALRERMPIWTAVSPDGDGGAEPVNRDPHLHSAN